VSYLHCPTCQRAYNVAREPACPSCGVRPGTPADPVADVIDAAEQLARAINRATPDQLAAAGAAIGARTRLALADGSGPIRTADWKASAGTIALRRVEPPPRLPAPPAALVTATLGFLARLPRPRIVNRLVAYLAR
jgi:hypothetical protein